MGSPHGGRSKRAHGITKHATLSLRPSGGFFIGLHLRTADRHLLRANNGELQNCQ